MHHEVQKPNAALEFQVHYAVGVVSSDRGRTLDNIRVVKVYLGWEMGIVKLLLLRVENELARDFIETPC